MDYYISLNVDHDSFYLQSVIEASVYLSFFMSIQNKSDGILLRNMIRAEYSLNLKKDYPNPKLIKEVFFSSENINQLKNDASLTLSDGYKDGYKVEFIEGLDNEFEFGNNTYQCPIENLYNHFCCLTYLPYICEIDFIRSDYFGTGLKRTKCLANGDPYCDFRWYKV